VGRKPNTAQLNLPAAGIRVDEYGGILVNSRLCTTAASGTVYAAGDVLGRSFLASTGVAQAQAAVEVMFDNVNHRSSKMKPSNDGPNDPVDDDVAHAGPLLDPASLAAYPFAFPTGVWSSPEFGMSSRLPRRGAKALIETEHTDKTIHSQQRPPPTQIGGWQSSKGRTTPHKQTLDLCLYIFI
jgi:hypothetical protein